jgi:two-component system NarL family sensor kinase
VVQLSTDKVIFLTLAIGGGFFSLFLFFFLALLRNYKLNVAHQKRVLHTIVTTQDQERFRISQELHDNVGSALTGIDYELTHLKNSVAINANSDATLEHLLKFQNKARQGLNAAIHDLSPFSTEEGDWLEAMDTLIYELERKGITVNLNVSGQPLVYSGTAQLNLYRLVQELMQNVVKHSKAKEIFISLNYSPTYFELVFEDDGKGFNVRELNNGFGFHSIKARTVVLGGEKKVVSSEELGTKWVFKFKNRNLLPPPSMSQNIRVML